MDPRHFGGRGHRSGVTENGVRFTQVGLAICRRKPDRDGSPYDQSRKINHLSAGRGLLRK